MVSIDVYRATFLRVVIRVVAITAARELYCQPLIDLA